MANINRHSSKDLDYFAQEYLKCRSNPLYFLYNYVYIPEIGGSMLMSADRVHPNVRRVVRSLVRYNKVMFMATRQLGKSTISAAMLEWAINFFPGIPAIILNMRQVAALENLDKIKFIHSHLPEWLRSPLKGRAEKKTYIELENNSIVRTFYPASNSGPNQIARSLTAPILYIDEVAFIRHIDIAYRSAQPVLSKAREQAMRNNYPYFILMTSTPNGTVGEGKFFYDMWNNAIDSDDLFDEDERVVDAAPEIIKHPDKNGFVKVRYHWSEDPTKSEEWYNEQKRELNFNVRSINQELDLIFIGSTTCIFDDEYLSRLQSRKPVEVIPLSHQTRLKVYHRLDPNRYYLIGVDTAKSITGDYCAIEIYDYETFAQVGEFFGRLGSLSKFSDIVEEVVQYCNNETNSRILVGVESNSIGSAIIEQLEARHLSNQMFVDPSSKDRFKYGIVTSSRSKDQMITVFYDYITHDPKLVCSSDLIDQLSVIEKHHNGSISAKSGYHDDLFMASCLCAYMRSKTLGDPKYLNLNDRKGVRSESNNMNAVLRNILVSNTKPFSDEFYPQSEDELTRTNHDFISDMIL